MALTWYIDDRRLLCPARGGKPQKIHTPESLPEMRGAGRETQACLYCHEPLTTVHIAGMMRWVVHEYLITEETHISDLVRA